MIGTTTLSALKALAKLYGGLVKSRAQRRQAGIAALAASIQDNFVKSNLYSDAIDGLGNALLASNRAGGFDSSTLSGGFNNLVSDLRTAQFNLEQGLATASAKKSAARMSLLDSAIGTGLGFVGGLKESKLQRKLADKIRSAYDIWNGGIGRQSLLTTGN
jgi:hypothetical protein